MSFLDDSRLWKEYEQLSSAAENLVGNSFQVPAVAVAIITALAISGNVDSKHFGFGILVGMFLLSVWLGYYHSTLNTYGLHLVKIESKLNRGLDKDSPERLTYYTDHVGCGPEGTNFYGLLLSFLILAGFIVSIRNILTQSNSGTWTIRTAIIVFPLLTVLSFANMVWLEFRVRRKKKEILEEVIELASSAKN